MCTGTQFIFKIYLKKSSHGPSNYSTLNFLRLHSKMTVMVRAKNPRISLISVEGERRGGGDTGRT